MTYKLSMLPFKLQPPTPRIPPVLVRRDGIPKPLTGLFDFTLVPKQARHGGNDGRVLAGLFDSVDRTAFALLGGFHKDGEGPYEWGGRAFLLGYIGQLEFSMKENIWQLLV